MHPHVYLLGVRGISDFKLSLHQYAQYWTPSSVKFVLL